MSLRSVFRLAVMACIAVTASGQAFGCQCSGGFNRGSSWDAAKEQVDSATAIFEGTPERFELQWDVLNAKEGELISAEDSLAKADRLPRMFVTFRVQRAYKGDLGAKIQIKTGLGGGDCGAVFATGLTYVIFARGPLTMFAAPERTPTATDLGVSMCSPGGWIDSRRVATQLRYLRKQRPIASDLAPLRPSSVEKEAAQEAQSRRDSEDDQKRYAAVTGKICGNVIAEKAKDGNTGYLSFLSTAGYSPREHPISYPNPDGSFCSGQLGPGKYYLYFSRRSDEKMIFASFYPGVSERTKAIAIEVSAGQTQSNISFKVSAQKTYAVRGIISTNNRSTLSGDVYVSLLTLDGDPVLPGYSQQPMDFPTPSPLPRMKFFDFENVLPGRYLAYVSVRGQGWYTRKREVNVTTHMKFISLELAHKK